MARGFCYLVAIMDWASRMVLSWRLSNTMDGKGRWMDNIFIERLWKSVKYEDIYLKSYASMAEVKNGLASYFPISFMHPIINSSVMA